MSNDQADASSSLEAFLVGSLWVLPVLRAAARFFARALPMILVLYAVHSTVTSSLLAVKIAL